MGKKLADSVARSIVFANVIVFSFAAALAAGPAKLTPDKPKWGDTVTVTYDPAVKGAKFLPGDTVYIFYDLKFPEVSKPGWAKLAVKDGIFQYDIKIPEGASFLSMFFMTMDGWDSNAMLRRMIFRHDGVAAEGAWQGDMSYDGTETGYLRFFNNERKLYPGNYSIYRDKWQIETTFKSTDQKPVIGREMRLLKKQGIKESPGLLRTLSWGYLLLDDEKASREVLRRMVYIYPENNDTAAALSEYDYQAFSKQIKGEGPEEVKQLKLELLRRNPGSIILRDSILPGISYEQDPPLDIIRTGCETWIKDEPENPTPHYTLAKVLLKKNGDLNEAAGLMAKALDRLVTGKLRLLADISGSVTERYLPDYYATAASIHEKLGDFSAAIAEIKAAQALSKEENRPDLFMHEASVWRSLGYFNKAEKSLLEARRRGAKSADGELTAIYQQRRKTDVGFDAWLAEQTKKQSPASSPGDKKPAPGFDVKDIDGETLRLADLKGKVVVLNFWFIGCAPCRVEMPGLNKLVEEFKPDEVVFIGFALDEESQLREFLKKIPFKYKIVAGASSIAGQYGASVFPTHVLINKQGLIEFTMTRGSPDSHEELRPLIQSLLK
jgi:peroxiredoxin